MMTDDSVRVQTLLDGAEDERKKKKGNARGRRPRMGAQESVACQERCRELLQLLEYVTRRPRPAPPERLRCIRPPEPFSIKSTSPTAAMNEVGRSSSPVFAAHADTAAGERAAVVWSAA